mmetsp:Transcript_24372/g.61667  ORF Transcript_24372/g.61667 Transcript_24372/m.61667 type:complete len:245 (-) Transcript_24372:1468-2202(-)
MNSLIQFMQITHLANALAERVKEAEEATSREFLEHLPLKVLTENEAVKLAGCTVCTDDFCEGTEVHELPCNHAFHPMCIIPWLKKASTCPTCRRQLPKNECSISMLRPGMIVTGRRPELVGAVFRERMGPQRNMTRSPRNEESDEELDSNSSEDALDAFMNGAPSRRFTPFRDRTRAGESTGADRGTIATRMHTPNSYLRTEPRAEGGDVSPTEHRPASSRNTGGPLAAAFEQILTFSRPGTRD